MSYIDRCLFRATSSGAGDFVVSAALTGYQTPASANAQNSATYFYAAESDDLSQWEVGFGVYTVSTTTLSRSTVLSNSSGTTSKIAFSFAPKVAVVVAAEGLSGALNVKSYGAVGDGSADDTTAIQNAISAMNSAGDGLYFPPGTYKVSSALNFNKPGLYFGSSEGSLLKTSSATADIIDVNSDFVTIQNLKFDSSVTRTAGSYVAVSATSDRFFLSGFHMENAFQGVTLNGGSTAYVENGTILSTVASTGIPLRVNGGADLHFSNITADAAAQTFAGIYVSNCADLTLDGLDLIHCGQALYLNPSSGDIDSIHAINCFFDTSTRAFYAFAQGGNIQRCRFTNCGFSSSTAEGVRIEGTSGAISGLEFIGCNLFSNASGYNILSSGIVPNQIKILGGAVAGNTGDGTAIAAGVSAWSIEGARIGPFGGITANGGIGINIAAGASDNFSIIGNDVRGNTGGAISNGSMGSNYVLANNVGYAEPWHSYTPTITAVAGSFTTASASGRAWLVDKAVYIELSLTITTVGTGTFPILTLPVAAKSGVVYALAGKVAGTGKAVIGDIGGNSSSTAVISLYDGSSPSASSTTINLSGVYEAA